MIEKPWGWELIIEKNCSYVVKKLFMKKGYQCSLQYHKKKTETIIVLKGILTIIRNGREYSLAPFETTTINPLIEHRMKAIEEDCLYLECSTIELDDVVRLEDSYGRV
jgi:mannose-6-phosphate isomerase